MEVESVVKLFRHSKFSADRGTNPVVQTSIGVVRVYSGNSSRSLYFVICYSHPIQKNCLKSFLDESLQQSTVGFREFCYASPEPNHRPCRRSQPLTWRRPT